MPQFEVKRDKTTLFVTEHKSCIPSKDRRNELKKAGYKLYLDGKIFKEAK